LCGCWGGCGFVVVWCVGGGVGCLGGGGRCTEAAQLSWVELGGSGSVEWGVCGSVGVCGSE